MRERLKLAVLAAIVALTLSVPRVRARKKQDKRAEAEALITRALFVSDLRAPGSPSFELRGIIEVHQAHGKTAMGTYLLLWESPNKWREEIHFADYKRIRVGSKGEFWQTRTTNYEILPVYDFSQIFGFTGTLRSVKSLLKDPKTKVKLRNRRIGGRLLRCFSFTHFRYLEIPIGEFCFDSQDGTLRREDNNMPRFGYHGPVTYSSFLTFDHRWFPGKTTTDSGSAGPLTFETKAISSLKGVPAAAFIQAPGAKLWPGCPNQSAHFLLPLKEPPPQYPADALLAHISGRVLVYVLVGADGAPHKMRVLASPFVSLGAASEAGIFQWRFKPSSCDGKPVPVETVIPVTFNIGE